MPPRGSNPPSNKSRRKPGPPVSGAWIWMIIGLALVAMLLFGTFDNRIEIPYSTFVKLIDNTPENVKKISFGTNDRIFGEIGSPDKLPTLGRDEAETKELLEMKKRFEDKRAVKFVTRRWPFQFDQHLLDRLNALIKDNNLKVDAPEDPYAWVGPLMLFLLPAVLLLGVFIFLVPKFRDPLGGNFLNSYVKSPARRYERGKTRITFEDVAGMQNAKSELQEVVEFLKTPEKFQKLGAQVPRGVLLVGPPGTGKTLLAKAVAGEAGVPFFSINGSEFIQMFVGVGASVTGDTPVLVRSDGHTRLMPIGEFIDTHYAGDAEGFVVPVSEVETLGFEELDSKFKGSSKLFLKGSAWSRVRGVYRHRVTEIHEIHYLGGMVRTTGDHSVFIRTRNGIKPLAARELKPGDVLVDLPSFNEKGWPLLFDKTGTPLEESGVRSKQGKKAIVREIIVKPYDGYVYDFCGCDNEAFFGGEKPILLHNSRVRDLFKNARENSPCIVFVDEVDAVGRMRGTGVGGGSDEREQTLNQILSEMDGFSPSETVIVVAATNRPDVLDAALLRPGRFDRHITIDRPTWQGRMAILKIHTRNKPLSDDVDLESVARGSIGMTGADLRNLANEAALLATREGKNRIDQYDFARAYDRVLMGPVREEVLGLEGRRRTAYHEAGHTLVGWMEPNADPPHKVTIIPRGQALGVTLIPPDEDRMHHGLDYWKAKLAFIMGGRAADRLMYKQAYSGHENDLKQATRLARYMVTHWGMSDRLGPMSFRVGEEHVFLGKELQEPRDFSEGTASVIDEEVQKLLREADERAYSLLDQNRDKLESLVEALLEREELLRDEIAKVLRGEKLPPLERPPPKKEPLVQPSFSPDNAPAVTEA